MEVESVFFMSLKLQLNTLVNQHSKAVELEAGESKLLEVAKHSAYKNNCYSLTQCYCFCVTKTCYNLSCEINEFNRIDVFM